MRRLLLVTIIGICATCRYPVDATPECGPYPPQASSDYALPYAVGSTFTVIQGNCTPGTQASHRVGWFFQYAYDFDMDIGTEVRAARDGVVIGTEDRFTDGNRIPGQENFVFVRHPDQTTGRYFHLTNKGVRVAIGQLVVRGELLGLSGDTGNSQRPHLHFDVTVTCPDVGCTTIPVVFRNTTAHPTGLVRGQSYTAEAWH